MPTGLVRDREILEEGQAVKAVLMMTLGEIIEMDIDQLNDYAQEHILDDMPDMWLTNISYTALAVGHENNCIDIEVFADLEHM